MSQTNVSVYGNSDLERFLYAEIGIEENGSSLTVLSALARGGEDPWDKAAQWANTPRPKVIDWLAADITRLPLITIDGAHDTAARLVQLLPSSGVSETKLTTEQITRWAPLMVLVCSMVIGLATMVAVSLHPDDPAFHRKSTQPAPSSIVARH